MLFVADFKGAIVIEAAQYGYGGKPGTFNHARAIGLHTPEEEPDDYPATVHYFHNLYNRNASTTYFVAAQLHYNAVTGKFTRIFQMVPERAGAYGNAVEGKPYPDWADPNVNLNLQTYSIEIEGYAHNIHLTMSRGSDQWNATAVLLADIGRRRSRINLDRTFPHSLVSNRRTDPGRLDIAALVADAKALNEEEESEDDMVIFIKPENRPEVFELLSGRHITNEAEFKALKEVITSAGGTYTLKVLGRGHALWKTGRFEFPNGMPVEYLS